MPKAKTHKGTAKRFRLTRRGKLMRHRANCNHILTKKSADRKRRLRKSTCVPVKGDVKKIKRMLNK